KSNDSVGDEAPGNEVEYTLRVTALHDDVNDVVLTDLPPEGFEYVPGSGDGAPFIHEYASPGIWDLGDMEAGETKTVTYRTRISDAQDDGLYKDLAFATGISGSGTILADDPVDDPDNALHDNFVGTRVIVAANANPTVLVPQDDENRLIEKTKKKIQYVLGAATLPLTGANGGWMLLALVLLATGIGLALWGRRLKKENQANDHATLMKTFLFTLFAGSLLLTGQGVSAASLAVQIEKPEALVNNPNFKIGFVTLDIEKREVTVKCYASYEGGPAVVFDQYTLLADPNFGGNSGDCQVDATVMPAEGDYGFFVTATAQNEEDIDEMATSETVPVKLVASPPGTPFNYDRHDASCQNTITFTTADDGGKTVKVELYRSPSATFTADASTKVDEQAIGSNANGSFNEAAPGCSNDYFYALRAVDAYGFGSGFVGDKDVNVDTHTVTHTKTNTVTVPGAPAEGALVAAPTGTGAAGAVEGATTGGESVTGEEGNVLGETIAGAEGAVSGMSTWITAHPWWSVLILLILMALGYYGYGVYQRKRHVPLQ
ncbi:MAG: hypothetical protein ABI747_00615, partial [Candidatus Moraniibacteriota bacterium]